MAKPKVVKKVVKTVIKKVVEKPKVDQSIFTMESDAEIMGMIAATF